MLKLVVNSKFAAKLEQLLRAAETLRTQLQEESIFADGLNYAAGAGRSFEDVGIDASLAKGVRANESGNAGADDESGKGISHARCCSRRENAQRVFEKSGLASRCCLSR